MIDITPVPSRPPFGKDRADPSIRDSYRYWPRDQRPDTWILYRLLKGEGFHDDVHVMHVWDLRVLRSCKDPEHLGDISPICDWISFHSWTVGYYSNWAKCDWPETFGVPQVLPVEKLRILGKAPPILLYGARDELCDILDGG